MNNRVIELPKACRQWLPHIGGHANKAAFAFCFAKMIGFATNVIKRFAPLLTG